MKFRKVVIATMILVLATTAGLAAYTIADEARGEAAQTTVEQTDELAVEANIVQKLVSDDDHQPTVYGETVDAELSGGGELNEGDDYLYYQENGSIEFLVDEDDTAIIDFTYDIPRDQVADDQLQTLTGAYGNVIMVAVGLAFVVLFLFIGGFAAKKMGVNSPPRGR